MVKHLAFWIGFFAAALIIIPVAVGIWGAADELARNLAVFIFGAVSILVLVLVIMLFFRDRLLRRVLGTAEATLDDASGALVKTVSAASVGDRATAEAEAQNLVRAASGWYVWSNFYRWVIASALGLLLAFGAFAGTVLLFEQTRKLGEQTELMSDQRDLMGTQTTLMENQSVLMRAQTDRMAEQSLQFQMQNEIMTVSLVSELRQQLASTVESKTLGEQLAELQIVDLSRPAFTDPTNTCGLHFTAETELRFPPSPSVIAAIADLATNREISDQVTRALHFLLRDPDGAVAFGALMVLDQLEPRPAVDLSDIVFSFLILDDVTLAGRYKLSFRDSILGSLTSRNSLVHVEDSYATFVIAERVEHDYSVMFVYDEIDKFSTNVLFLEHGAIRPQGSAFLSVGSVFDGNTTSRAAITNTLPSDTCAAMHALATTNGLFEYSEAD